MDITEHIRQTLYARKPKTWSPPNHPDWDLAQLLRSEGTGIERRQNVEGNFSIQVIGGNMTVYAGREIGYEPAKGLMAYESVSVRLNRGEMGFKIPPDIPVDDVDLSQIKALRDGNPTNERAFGNIGIRSGVTSIDATVIERIPRGYYLSEFDISIPDRPMRILFLWAVRTAQVEAYIRETDRGG